MARPMTSNAARLKITALALTALSLPLSLALSQTQADSMCTYHRCALGIAPTWNGLAVVRGVDEQRVTNLSFFWPRDIGRTFSAGVGPAADSARRQARDAVRLRRFAAGLTDAGLVLGGYTVTRAAANGSLNGADKAIGIAAATAFAVSVPLQFAADGALSRAVWWYNTRFGP